jgi:hypothetical protein
MNSRFRQAVALLLIFSTTGCSAMAPVAQPKNFVEARRPEVVWLTTTDEPVMKQLDGPKLQGDTIVGFIEGEYTEIPLVNVKAMQAKQYSRKKTTLFALIASAIVVGLIFTIEGGVGADTDMIGEDDIGVIRH